MHYIKFYSLLFVIGFTFFSCSKKDYEAQIPTYISIDQITLTTNQSTQGSSSSNITDAWVYVNDDLVGVYELPANFPVLKEGNATIKIYAGIKDNGISATRVRYLLYDPYVEQVNLVKGETIQLIPTVTYSSGVTFEWLEDFETASLSFLYTTGSDTVINKTAIDVKEGAFSGQIFLASGMDFFELTSVAYSTIPHTGAPVYLELDFKTNEPLLIGVYLDANQYSFLTLNTTADWKKVYVNLTAIINNNSPASAIKIFLGIKATANDPFATSNPEFLLDNIKLVHL